MSRVCELCGKRIAFGRQIARRGLPKSKGGIGLKTTGVSPRVFRPNLQKVRILEKGRARRARVCTACIRSGRIRKAP
ncbi:MAG: 50S ribosomal protein L28 [Planctomycetes bacterium]|nr:50S ribosomal protein L28 [Planctomycetota bacterium]